MEFEISTFVGAGPLLFGMTSQKVRSLLPGPVRSFKRTPNVMVPSDHFTELGVVVNYDPTGAVSSIEFSRPSNPTFRGESIFERTIEQATSFLRQCDPTVEVEIDGVTSHQLGLGFYALKDDLEADDPGEILSVIAFEKGYYATPPSKPADSSR